MSVDLTGGLPVTREYVFAEPPTVPGMRDSVNMWVWDDEGALGLPRIAVESVAPEWDTHEIQVNITLPDSRVLRDWEPGRSHPKIGRRGLATIFGAGPLEFECVEPFRHYRATYDGRPTDTDFAAQAHGQAAAIQAHVRFEVDCEMAAPPWVQGAMSRAASAR